MIVDVQLVEICVSTDASVENNSQEHMFVTDCKRSDQSPRPTWVTQDMHRTCSVYCEAPSKEASSPHNLFHASISDMISAVLS